MPAKEKKQSVRLSADTFFYVITLENGELMFTRDMLEKHYPVPKSRKLYYGNQVDYTGYSSGIVSVYIKLNNGEINSLYLHVEPDALHVACTCGMPDGQMCLHAYIGLYNIAWAHSIDLKPFYQPGFGSDEKVQLKFLDVQVTKNRIYSKPRPMFGRLFRPVVGFEDLEGLSLGELLPERHYVLEGNRQVIAFCIGYGEILNMLGQLPVLIACQAQTSRDNTSLISFKELGEPIENIDALSIGPRQLVLMEKAAEMRSLSVAFGKSTYDSNEPKHRAIKSAFMILWEEVMQLIIFESFTYTFRPVRVLYQKGKLKWFSKHEIRPCRFSAERPELYFILKHHHDHFSLAAALSVNGVELNVEYKTQLFVVEQGTNCHYLMDSLEADDLFNWMHKYNNRLTILNQHFTEFHHTFLKNLSEYYRVYFIAPGTGKKSIYQLDQMANYAQ